MREKYSLLLPSLFIAGILLGFKVQAGIQDSTLDFVESVPLADDKGTEYFSGQADPWTPFFAKLSGFNQVRLWGLSLEGESPYQKNENLPLVPASVQKVVTTAAALRNLGRDMRFPNYFEGQLDSNGVDLRDPKFTVSADPTWGHEEFESIRSRLSRVISELKSKGVKRVIGPIKVLALHPELAQIPMPSGWPKRWTLQCMATQPTAFMFHGNCGSIQVNSLTSAEWTLAGVDVPLFLNLKKSTTNSMAISAALDNYGRIQSYTISGGFAKSTSTFFDPLQNSETSSVPIHLSERWLQNLFKLILAENGISYEANASVFAASPGARCPCARGAVWVDLSSLSMVEILRVAVSRSINGVLDRIFYETAFHENIYHPAEPSLRVLREVVGVESLMKGVEIFDGSGLVMNNRLRGDLLTKFLGGLESQPYFSDFLSTLAVAGESGTLANRLTGPLTKGKIFAKTGTIDGIYNLAGYFKTQSQTYEPFAILSDSNLSAAQVRGMIDKIATQFAITRARSFDESLR
ncbi:MAG: D-alanyl-D-alanine carboxypeptidase/D-alanyl-D-alanine-endopeptidase [Bdellovibrionales bacterium]|nr:D-alanyl-D-alanine carboxypeptidase/D-alanyl-D-alanine-endopeptidase [Oligoflexia bacterium]